MSQIRFLLVWPFLPFTLPYFLTISDIYPCLLDISSQNFFIFHKVCDTFFWIIRVDGTDDCLCLNLSICIDIHIRYPNKPSETNKMLHLLTVNIWEKLFFVNISEQLFFFYRNADWASIGMLCILEGSNDQWHVGS